MENDRRSDTDLRRLFEELSKEKKAVSELTTEIKVFMATRDLEYRALKTRQEEIERNQKCIIEHLNKMKLWLYAGSAVVLVLVGLGKAVFWVYENAPSILEILLHGKTKI